MKNIFFALLLLSSFTALNAQNEEYRSTISATAGLNIYQVFDNAFKQVDLKSGELKIKSTGSYGLTYDYAVNKWFSIGGGLAYHKISAGPANISYTKSDSTLFSGSFGAKATRTNIGVRTLFHYGNAGKIDMYSGLRLGMSVWNFTVNADTELAYEDLPFQLPVKKLGVRVPIFAPQFIPFGLRAYINDNIGVGFELAVGAPSYMSANVNYRFGGSTGRR